jgi:hypothetical protein
VGSQHRIIASATPSNNRIRDLRGLLHLLQTVASTSDEIYDRLIASARKIRLQPNSKDNEDDDDGDTSVTEEHLSTEFVLPTTEEF